MPAQEQATTERTNRRVVYDLLEGSWETSVAGRIINIIMIVLIVASVIAVMLASVDVINDEFGDWFEVFNIIVTIIFSIEYLMRIWSAPEHPQERFQSAIRGRIRFALTPMAIIDLIAVLPLYLMVLVPGLNLTFIRIFRLFRLLKLSRYFPAMQLLGRVTYTERRALLSAFFVMMLMLIFSSSLMYLIENQAQPEKFSSIPAAMWWGMATLTTVGYGDITPVTALGQFFGTLIAIFGMGMFALPAAILASGFTREMQKNSFMNRWHAVAGVPVFADMTATEIGEIAAALHAETAVPGEVLFVEGDYANEVFFIVSGRVQIELNEETFLLSRGDFFGELALLDGRTRQATARTLSSCSFLVLDQVDFENLCDAIPDIHTRFTRVAEQRLYASKRPLTLEDEPD